jgi:hypothetical protein
VKKILMSVENPNGYKLEELLVQIRGELVEKSKRLSNDCPINTLIRYNNGEIIAMLKLAETYQRDTMAALDTLGEDPGPTGTPRA